MQSELYNIVDGTTYTSLLSLLYCILGKLISAVTSYHNMKCRLMLIFTKHPSNLNNGIIAILLLEGTASCAGLLLSPAEGFGLRPMIFWSFGQKKKLFVLFLLILGHFQCSVVTFVTLNKILKKYLKNLLINLKKSKKSKDLKKQ